MSAAVAHEEPCIVCIDARGAATVEIPDAEGEVHSYSIESAPEGLDAWACSLRRLDGEGDSPYRVARNLSGSWRCSCGDSIYRARKESRLCKHARAARNIALLIDRLGGTEDVCS